MVASPVLPSSLPPSFEPPSPVPESPAPPSPAPPSPVAPEVHAPATQLVPLPQLRHSAPTLPHALLAVPPRHCPAEQHPEHVVASHSHSPETQ